MPPHDLSRVSVHGRRFLLFLFASALLSGPLANMFENVERAATSLLCGAEVAANQTQELMQHAATPLFSKTRLCVRQCAQFRVRSLDVGLQAGWTGSERSAGRRTLPQEESGTSSALWRTASGTSVSRN